MGGALLTALSALTVDAVPILECWYIRYLAEGIGEVQHDGPATVEDATKMLASLGFALVIATRAEDLVDDLPFPLLGRQPTQSDAMAANRRALAAGAHEFAADGAQGWVELVARLVPAVRGELDEHRGDIDAQVRGIYKYTLLALIFGTDDPSKEPSSILWAVDGVLESFDGWFALDFPRGADGSMDPGTPPLPSTEVQAEGRDHTSLNWMDEQLRHPDGRARGGEPCVLCGQPIPTSAHWKHRDRHVCSVRCNHNLTHRFHRQVKTGKLVHPPVGPEDRETMGASNTPREAELPSPSLIPTPRTGQPSELLWAVVKAKWLDDPILVVLPRATVDRWMERIPVLGCSTWGELHRTVSTEVYEEVLELSGYGSFEGYTAHLDITGTVPLVGVRETAAAMYDPEAEPPADDTPFAASDDMAACADGDWPPGVAYLMEEELPDELLNAYAERTFTVFNGVLADIAGTHRDAVLADLKAAGYRLTEDPRLEELVNCRY